MEWNNYISYSVKHKNYKVKLVNCLLLKHKQVFIAYNVKYRSTSDRFNKLEGKGKADDK